MSQRCLRQKPRTSYYEPEEPNLDEYVYCDKCADLVYEYCSIHGPLLVIPDDKVPVKPNVPSFVPRAALTIPNVFLHLAPSSIPSAGLGVFATVTLPSGVRFGPYTGKRTDGVDSYYCWQIYDVNRKPSYCIDAANAQSSNWMRYVNCARHWSEQNLVAYQYQGQLYYRTVKIIPRFTELLVFYGSEFANELDIDLGKYNSSRYAIAYGLSYIKKREMNDKNPKTVIEQGAHTPEAALQDFKNEAKVPGSNSGNTMDKKDCKKTNANTYIDHPHNNKPKTDNNDTKASVDSNPPNTYHFCDICADIYMTKYDIEKHMKINQTNVCEVSSNRFDYLTDLNDHKFSIHQIKHTNVHVCEICDKTFCTASKLQSHLVVHIKGKQYSGATYISKFARGIDEEHQRTRTDEKLLECTSCNAKFTDSSSLKIHTQTHTGKKTYECDTCKKKFTTGSNLKRHERTHSGQKPYTCATCKSKFTDGNSLKRHERTHTGQKPYACDTCDMKFTSSSSLKRHERTHTGQKPYACATCDMKFTSSSSLKVHERTHTGQKPYACATCDMKFTSSSSLKVHERTHTGQKPYACATCDMKFTSSSSLKKHERTHTGQKPYACATCDMKFTSSSSLKRHERTHTGQKPYACTTCDKKFTNSSSLKAHERTHTGQKPYVCATCDLKFTNSSSLKRHERTHTGQKPYACATCKSKFPDNSHLKRHERTHTRQNI